MAFFEFDQIFTYQDANDIKKLWATTDDLKDTDEAADGEIRLDLKNNPIRLMRRNRNVTPGGWEVIGTAPETILDALKTVAGSGSGLDADTVDGIEGAQMLRCNADDTFSGTLTSSKGSGVPMKFDNGGTIFTVHDGSGNFNIKSGVDENHTVVNSDGGSHIQIMETGGVTIFVTGQTVGNTFSDDSKLSVTADNVTINDNTAWHAGNDGAGSGLDADKLDGFEGSYYKDADTLSGQPGSFYTDAANLGSGNISRARLGELSNVANPYICAGKTNVATPYQSIGYGTVFSNSPKVVASCDSVLIPRITSVSTSTFQVQLVRSNFPTNDFWPGTIYWIAFGNKV